MSPAHLVPALFVAVIIIWIGTSVIYQDYAPSAKKYLDDRGLSVETYPAAAPSVPVVNSDLVRQNRKDIDAILKKLGMTKAS